MKCPHCNKDINIGKLLGSTTTPAKAKASRENGRLGGRKTNQPQHIYRSMTKEEKVELDHQCKTYMQSHPYTPDELAEIERNRALIAKRTSAYQ